ncbi:hypothetical protein BST61_g2450 [Cercospora zeina]
MQLLDSVMEESQRTGSPRIAGLERLAIRDTRLPDGTLLPRGSHIAVDQSGMRDAKHYSDPEMFDGFRYYKRAMKVRPSYHRLRSIACLAWENTPVLEDFLQRLRSSYVWRIFCSNKTSGSGRVTAHCLRN